MTRPLDCSARMRPLAFSPRPRASSRLAQGKAAMAAAALGCGRKSTRSLKGCPIDRPTDLGTHYAATGSDSFLMGSANVTLYAEWKTPFSTWANGANFTDPNSEGIAYGMAWMLGAGTSTSPSVPLLPAAVPGSGLTMHFKRVHDQGAAKLYFQYSSDLVTWPDPGLLIPDNQYGTGIELVEGITAAITEGDPDDVTVTVVPAGHEAAGKLFGRLKATEN